MTNTSATNKDAAQTSVQVALRIRPLTELDRNQPRFSKQKATEILAVTEAHNSVTIVPYNKQFTFDHVFGTDSTQESIFDTCVRNLLQKFIQGYNVTILAYGQTSSGKTYTMGTASGAMNEAPETIGIIPRAISTLFESLNAPSQPAAQGRPSTPGPQGGSAIPTPTRNGRATPTRMQRPMSMPVFQNLPSGGTSNNNNSNNPGNSNTKTTIRVSFVEIYNEELIDLLNTDGSERSNVQIREDNKGNIYWTGVREVIVNSPREVMQYLAIGSQNRQVGATDMNEKSSRSHAIFSVTLRQEKWSGSGGGASIATMAANRARPSSPTPGRLGTPRRDSLMAERASSRLSNVDDGEITVINSKFHFVDLAGSERLKRTSAVGERIKEGISINAGLLALGNVISALGDASRKVTHIPYRDSKLTRLLQDSLGGNAQTLMIACVSPAEYNLSETVNTIKYANRARNIKNTATLNHETLLSDNVDHLKALIAKLKSELQTLKTSGDQSTPHPGGSAPGDENREKSRDDQMVEQLESQMEELQLSFAELSERHVQVEAELNRYKRMQSNTAGAQGNSASFQEMVEPVVQQYEKEITSLESELALTRAALRHSEATLEEYEAKLRHHEVMNEHQRHTIADLRNKLAKQRERDKTSDQYIGQLETQLSEITQEHERQKIELLEMREKLAHSREVGTNNEDYIGDLETRLTKAQQDAQHAAELYRQFENKIEEREAMIEDLKERIKRAENLDLQKMMLAELDERDKSIQVLERELKEARSQPPATNGINGNVSSPAGNKEENSGNSTEAEALKQRIAALEQQLTAVQKTHQDTLKNTTELTKKYEDSLAKSAQLEAALLDAQRVAASSEEKEVLNGARRDLDAALADKEGLAAQMHRLRQENEELDAQIGELHTRIQEKAAEHASETAVYQATISRLETELVLVEEQHAQAVRQLDIKGQAEGEDAEEAREQAWQTQLRLEKRIRELEGELVMARELHSKSQAGREEAVLAASMAVADSQNRLQQLEEEKAVQEKHLVELRTQYSDLLASLEKNVSTLPDTHTSSLESVQNSLKQLSELHEKCTHDLETQTALVAKLKQRLMEAEIGSQRALSAKLEENEKLRLDLNALRQVEQNQEAVIHAQDEEIRELRAEVERREERVRIMGSQFDQVRADITEMEREKNSWFEDKETLEKRIHEYDTRIEALEAELGKVEMRSRESESELNEARSVLARSASELAGLQKAIQLLEQEKQEAATERERLRQRNDELAAEFDRMTSESDALNILQDNLQKSRADLQACEAQLQEAKGQISEHAKRSAELEAMNHQLTVSAENNHKVQKSKVAELEQKLSTLEEEHQRNLQEVVEEMSRVEAERDAIQERFSLLQKAASEEEEKGVKLEAELNQLRLSLTQKEEMHTLIENEKSSLSDKISELQTTNAKLQERLEKLEQEYTELKTHAAKDAKEMQAEMLQLMEENERLVKTIEDQERASSYINTPPQTPRSNGAAVPLPPSATSNLNQKLVHLQNTVQQQTKMLRALEERNAQLERERRAMEESISDERRASNSSSAAGVRSSSRTSNGPSLPPPTPPPNNPLPPPPPTAFAPPSSPPPQLTTAPMTSRPAALQRAGSLNSVGSAGSTDSIQYEKTVAQMNKRISGLEADLRAHQEIVHNVESQLQRTQTQLRESRKDNEVLARDNQALAEEVEASKGDLERMRKEFQDAITSYESKLRTLEDQVSQERKQREKAERARGILENRIEDLVQKKSKFICF
ncbi:uncharacterized protein VTP21DRAFT_7448 [Calcarisporiella thermophila]|uniref:uncharacterized protein n=1 Tax=Calcarisporiella thermophila TaxID=911321 RepID=UPI003742EEE3